MTIAIKLKKLLDLKGSLNPKKVREGGHEASP